MVVCTCNPSYSGGWGKRITWSWEVEIAVSWELRLCYCTPAWVMKQDSVSRKNKILHCFYERNMSEVFSHLTIILKLYRPGAVAQACNPSTSGGLGEWITRSRDWDHPGQHGETLSLLKIQKISWAWWHVPVISATREAEAGELPEPRRRRLQWAEIAPLHSSLGNKSETPSQKNKK